MMGQHNYFLFCLNEKARFFLLKRLHVCSLVGTNRSGILFLCEKRGTSYSEVVFCCEKRGTSYSEVVFCCEKGGKVIRNSFTENLGYGELFEAKSEILKDIKSYLERATDYKFVDNYMPDKKLNVKGYHTLRTVYNGKDKKLAGRTVEFQFEDKGQDGIAFHFIKFLKIEEG